MLDLDKLQLELWYGTKLDAFHLPGIVWMDSELLPDENNVGIPNRLNLTKSKAANTKFKPGKVSADFFDGKDVTSSLAFAEPMNFDVWVLVKWTVVVLFLAGIATFFLRGKQVRLPTLQTSRELRLLETLVVDQRARLHIVAVGGERFLVSTDLTGVKSTTLVPNWGMNADLGEESAETAESMNQSAAILISEAG